MKKLLKEECALLNEFITEGRYPGDLPFESIGKEEAKEAVGAASRIEEFVMNKVGVS